MTRLLAIGALLVLTGQARDVTRPPSTGTALISGGVVSDDQTSKPVRRAVVTAFGAEGIGPQTAITDDQGRFVLRDLPAGRYSLSVSKPGWVTRTYGATSSRTPGIAIALTDAQRITDLSIRLARGAVLAGRVVDADGRPMQGLRPMALEYRSFGGQRRLQQTFAGTIGLVTDDRGEFRIFGLPAGTYLLGMSLPFAAQAGFRQIAPAELQWARQQAAPGAATAPPPAQTGAQAYAPTYFPGVDDPAMATAITLAAGEERSGLEFSIRPVFTSRLSGVVTRADGQPLRSVQIAISQLRDGGVNTSSVDSSSTIRVTADPSGRFVVPALRPGRHLINARAPSAPPAPAGRGAPGAPPRPAPVINDLWATAEIIASGQPIDNLTLTLQAGVTIAGRIALDSAIGATADVSRVRVQMIPAAASGSLNVSTSNVYLGTANADGTFMFPGVAPDRYMLSAYLTTGTSAPVWMTKSIIAAGRDVTEGNFEIQTAPVSDVVITFTDRVGEISGRLLDAAGRPAPEYFVFVFPADRQSWTQFSRRMRPPQRPSSDGKFRVTTLPPGDYLVVALTDNAEETYLDATFLEQLLPGAIKITLGEGEKRVQDLKIGGK